MRRHHLRRLAVVLLTGPLMLGAACGSGARAASGADPVDRAQARLAKIDRATIDLRLTAESSTGGTAKPVGFALAGPFALPKKNGALPVAKLTSTRLLGDRHVETTFVSTGTRAWVETDGRAVELQGKQLDSVRGTTSGAHLDSLHLRQWFATRKVTRTASTTTVTGTLDAPAALNDVLAMAGGAGGATSTPLTGKDADRLRSLVRSSSVELVTATGDATPRSLHFDVRFAPEDEAAVAKLLPNLAGVAMTFDLKLTDVGRPVTVRPPKGA